MESGLSYRFPPRRGRKNNIHDQFSWTMRRLDFTPRFAINDGRVELLRSGRSADQGVVIAIPTVDLLDQVVGIGTCSARTRTSSPGSN